MCGLPLLSWGSSLEIFLSHFNKLRKSRWHSLVFRKLVPLLFALKTILLFSSVQLLSHVWLFPTPWIAARQASLSITNSQNFLKLKSIEPVMPSSHLILCHPLLLLPPTPPSIRVFSNESTLRIRWPKYWSFSFNISPSNEHPELVSFRMDWLDLLAVQGTLKILLQHHSSKASILLCSAFFIVQLSDPYMTTGKTIALTRRTFNVFQRQLCLFHGPDHKLKHQTSVSYTVFHNNSPIDINRWCTERVLFGHCWIKQRGNDQLRASVFFSALSDIIKGEESMAVCPKLI